MNPANKNLDSGHRRSKNTASSHRLSPLFGGALHVVAAALVTISTLSHAAVPFTEDFSTTTFEDVGATSADWNTGSQLLLLPTSATLTGTVLDSDTTADPVTGDRPTRSVEMADFDGDGDLDLIEGTTTDLGVQLNDGSGNFGARVFSANTGNTRTVAVGDLDRDGDIDFVSGSLSREVRLFLNDGTGTSFTAQNISSDTAQTNNIEIVDINGDGLLDVVAVNLLFQKNRIYLNTGDPLQPFGPNGSAGIELGNNLRESSRFVISGDLDNDGDIDLVVLNEDTQNPNDGNRNQRNRVFMNQLNQGSPNSFVSSEIEITGTDDIEFTTGGDLGDVDGDGFLDLVVANFDDLETSRVYLNDAVGVVNANPFTIAGANFAVTGQGGAPSQARRPELADADADGDLDVFAPNSDATARNRVYLNDGSGGFASFNDLGSVGDTPETVFSVTGDVDGDGDTDWLVGNEDQNVLYRNTGVDDVPTAQQLSAHATSLAFDTSGTVTSVKLSPAPNTSMVGAEFHNTIDYWVTGDAGLTWSVIQADGRPVTINGGTDIRWKANLNSRSPAMAAGLDLSVLDISENATGPVVTTPIADTSVTEDDGATNLPIASDFSDADGDAIFYSVLGLPVGSGLAIDPLTGSISGTPTNEDSTASPITVTVLATDGSISATDEFELTVVGANDAPTIDSLAVTAATQDVVYTYNITASDPDLGDTALLVITAPTLPAWMTFTDIGGGSATLSGTPSNAEVGDHTVSLLVTDPGALTGPQDFTVTVADVAEAPEIVSVAVMAATQDAAYTYNIIATDPDAGDTALLVISAPTLPAWMTLTDNGAGSATLSGTPSNAEVGDHTVSLLVTDPGALTGPQDFTVTVADVAEAPTIVSLAVTAATQDLAYTYSVTATDPDFGETSQLVISAPTLPAWMTFTDNGGGSATLSGTPTNAEVGDHAVSLLVTDLLGLTDTQDFTVTVTDVAEAPTIDSLAITAATQGDVYTYNIMATDIDAGDTALLVISAPTLPAWMTFTDNGGGSATLSGTPTSADVGDHTVSLLVTDAGGLTGVQDFSVAVAVDNVAPQFTSVPVTAITEGAAYSYAISAVDADGDAIAMTIAALPAWMTFVDNGDGTALLTGAPSGADVGVHPIDIQALEVAPAPGLFANQQFDITVTAAADGPTITVLGSANVTIDLNQTYSDAGATAADPQDGDLTAGIVTNNPVDVSLAGVYTVSYSVNDSAGNSAQAQRLVTVSAAPPPPPRSGGGGSAGLTEVTIVLLLALFVAVRRTAARKSKHWFA